MSEDSFLGKSLKCFEIFCDNKNLIVEIVKEEVVHTEILDPTMNTNTLALRICNKYDIPFILIKNEIEIKKKEFFSKINKIEVLREELKPDYQILSNPKGLLYNKSAFLVFNNNVKLNNTIDSKKQKSLEKKGSVRTTNVNTFSKTSLNDNAKSIHIYTEKQSKHEALKANKEKINNVKKIIVKSNDKISRKTNKNECLYYNKIPSKMGMKLKINLNDNPCTFRTPEKKLTISDRDLLVNRIYNSKIVINQPIVITHDNKFSKVQSNTYRKSQFYTPVKEKSNISKENTIRTITTPVMKQSRSFNNKLNNNILENKLNNDLKAKRPKKKQTLIKTEMLKRSGNVNKKEEIVKKILSYIFIEMDKDTDNKISIKDFSYENSSIPVIRLFLPVKDKFIDNEYMTKEGFISYCEEIYMSFSRMDKISLIDWYLDKKSLIVKVLII